MWTVGFKGLRSNRSHIVYKEARMEARLVYCGCGTLRHIDGPGIGVGDTCITRYWQSVRWYAIAFPADLIMCVCEGVGEEVGGLSLASKR